jgi:hypothetical protein
LAIKAMFFRTAGLAKEVAFDVLNGANKKFFQSPASHSKTFSTS